MARPRARGLGGLGALVTVVGALASAGPALATTTTQTITSAGPLRGITIGEDLDCQVQYAGWTGGAFYPTESLGSSPATGDCGTFVSVGTSVYGPDFSENYASGTGISLTTAGNYVAYTPGVQSGVSGAGTASSPYAVTSGATAGASGIAITESDRYVSGQDGYTTIVTLTNTTGAPVSGLLYRAADCFVQGSDDGYGDAESGRAIACTTSADEASGGPAEELDPATPGSHYVEGYFNDLWGEVDAQTVLPDSCDCMVAEDNAIGLSWDFTLLAGSSAQYVLHMNFALTSSASGSGTNPGSSGGSSGGQGKETSRQRVRLTLRQSARHHRSAASLSLPAGFTGERVRAALHGAGVRAATGTVTYSLYRGRSCTARRRVVKGARRSLHRGRAPASARVTTALRPGRYSWQVVYSGNRTLQRAKSICGRARLTILK